MTSCARTSSLAPPAWGSSTRSSARRCTRISRPASVNHATRPPPRRWRGSAPPPAATAAARRGAPLAAAERLNRALDESPAEQERAEILAELGRYEVAAMRFEAAEEHLRAVVSSGADVTTRAQAASTLEQCAIVSG